MITSSSRANLQLSDIDIIEINEAFAAQRLSLVKVMGIDMEKLNPHGGAIALGHPLGCSGARIIATLINDLQTADKTLGIATFYQRSTTNGMCWKSRQRRCSYQKLS